MSALDQALLRAVQQQVSSGIVGKVFAFAQALEPLPDPENWYDMPLGIRDKRLLSIRAMAFGSDFAGTVTCNPCKEKIEFNVDIGDFISLSGGDNTFQVSYQGRQYSFRPLSTRDLMAISNSGQDSGPNDLVKILCLDDDLVKDRILERPEFIERVNQALEEHQCISDIALTSDCPECRHTMKSIFDIVHVLDADITHAAGLFLEEIHQLATAYGWTEDTIFSVPRARRNWYVKRIQAK